MVMIVKEFKLKKCTKCNRTKLLIRYINKIKFCLNCIKIHNIEGAKYYEISSILQKKIK